MKSSLDQRFIKQTSYIDGAWLNTENQEPFEVKNPATGEILVSMYGSTASDAEDAVTAAQSALPSWRAYPAKQRSAILKRWFDLIMENQEWGTGDFTSKCNTSL